MADTGDVHPTPDHWGRIKPADLRVECLDCGGRGRVDNGTQLAAGHIVRGVVGKVKCWRCNGTGWVLPRKVDL